MQRNVVFSPAPLDPYRDNLLLSLPVLLVLVLLSVLVRSRISLFRPVWMRRLVLMAIHSRARKNGAAQAAATVGTFGTGVETLNL